ncbi:SDR family oxidoreductase [Celeribacter indicus]|uniref:Short chain dehydrogenase n=1 Tax=Celeribacter indicus TaxID=1208324 RepID=A0A0B5EA38_9RHOB|nr:SDR family oxidoreductase [Celeribacter indicus]AJE49152.1 short chain dehydrogenase [Celeribacter indicus]SDX17658.1 NADP-dependent 3-hydroxy acid dehydrogenase YdfG [Celeribacter indicus]
MSGAVLHPGQVAVVTGGAAGIGFALAAAFLGRGLRVVLADRDTGTLDAAAARLAAAGHSVRTVPTDVSRPEDMRRLRETVLATEGRVDILVNNAGIYPGMQPVWTIDRDSWRALYDVNYWGVVHGIQEFVPQFIAQGSGTVVTTASMSGLSTVPGSADYSSAKHAVVALTETLRADLDLAGHGGIGVTLLCPSVVLTDMGRRALGVFEAEGNADERSRIGSGPDLSAVLTPEALAEAALAGIEAGDLYVLPTPRSRDRFLGRIRPILAAFAAAPITHGALEPGAAGAMSDPADEE